MRASDRARAYLAKLPTAVSGSAGHSTTYAAACRLVEFGLVWEEAWSLFVEWNAACKPPWSEAELHHKLSDAYSRTKPRADFAQRIGRRGIFRPWVPPAPKAARPYFIPAEIQAMKQVRPAIPLLSPGTREQHAQVAALRGLSLEGVSLAVERGLLRFGMFHGAPAWLITDKSGRVAQARRLDGQPWGNKAKAWTLFRSQAKWTVGIEEASNYKFIALVEGGPDLLAAHHFIAKAGRASEAGAVAVLGGMRIHPDALPLFSWKYVRIYAQNDRAGERAALRWQQQLNEVGAVVEIVSIRTKFNEQAKDLNDVARLDADAFRTSVFP